MQIIIYSTREDITETLEGSFKNLKDVKDVAKTSLQDLKITVKETRTVLESDNSLLPDGYSTLTLVCSPSKMKSGN